MKTVDLLQQHMTERRIQRLERVLLRRTRDITIVIDRFNKPHNYMAILRTCEAFGLQDVHIILPESMKQDGISKSITQGADKWLTLHYHDDWTAAFAALRELGYRIYASYLLPERDTQAENGLEALEPDGKIALLMGNELDGLEPEQAKAADGLFMLPMLGFTQSFNVSVACALSVQRLMLLREAHGITLTPLSEAEQDELRVRWYKLAVPNSARIIEEHKRREPS